MATVYNNAEVPYIQTFIFEHTGEIRSNIFYCFVREILPNGMSWTKLTQEKVDLMFSHIDSVPRDSLAGFSSTLSSK